MLHQMPWGESVLAWFCAFVWIINIIIETFVTWASHWMTTWSTSHIMQSESINFEFKYLTIKHLSAEYHMPTVCQPPCPPKLPLDWHMSDNTWSTSDQYFNDIWLTLNKYLTDTQLTPPSLSWLFCFLFFFALDMYSKVWLFEWHPCSVNIWAYM